VARQNPTRKDSVLRLELWKGRVTKRRKQVRLLRKGHRLVREAAKKGCSWFESMRRSGGERWWHVPGRKLKIKGRKKRVAGGAIRSEGYALKLGTNII